jgi:hypothetical protein
MDLFEFIFSGFTSLLVPLVAIIWFFWFVNRDAPTGPNQKSAGQQSAPEVEWDPRDDEWREFLENFKKRDVSKAEAALIDRLLKDKSAPGKSARSGLQEAEVVATSAVHDPKLKNPTVAEPAARPVLAQEVDGTLLLLYFGAFLFVAAAGLFVAFSDIAGAAKTAVVMAVMYAMYMGGIWLYGSSKRLRPAGVAFAAIGMAIAPLIGLSAHYYVTQGQYVPLIWGATSLLCIALYAYALTVMKQTFISYLFIFSFLSLFESAVAIVEAPVHYYIWVLILAGMILKFAGIIRENHELRQPAAISSHIIVPLSIFVSFAAINQQGRGQLSVTLLLAAIYYTIEALRPSLYRLYFALAAQVLAITGLALGASAIYDSPLAPAICLMVLTALQAAVLWAIPRRYYGEILLNLSSIAFIASLPAFYLAAENGLLMTAAVLLVIALGLVIAVRQRRWDAYAGAALAFIGLPFVAGIFAASTPWSNYVLTATAFIPVLVLWAVWRWLTERKAGEDWNATGLAVYAIAGVVALLPALQPGGWVFLAACAGFALTLIISAHINTDKHTGFGTWAAAAGVIASTPVLREFYTIETPEFAAAALFALAVNILLAYQDKAEFNRWMSAGLGLLAPIAIGAGGLGFKADETAYAYLYLLAMVILLFGRGLARGVYLLRTDVRVSSLNKSASISYVIGYALAGMLSVLISLGSTNSPLHTSLILLILLLIIPYIAVVIEKQKRLLVFMPWLAIFLLLSLFRPTGSTAAANAVILAAAAIAVLSYYVVCKKRLYFEDAYDEVRRAILAVVYLPLFLCLVYDTSDIIPPLTLAIAGLVTMYHAWQSRQADREASGGIVVIAIMWALASIGVTNIQSHTHIIAATFALYAFWRHVRDDRENSDKYLVAMLGSATIPLVLQALSGTAGDGYGWWLLLEQVGFMILGITISRSFVTYWGLYVALGAVLYQLRHLGWAALSFLAIFIIGMAMFRLLRSGDRK